MASSPNLDLSVIFKFIAIISTLCIYEILKQADQGQRADEFFRGKMSTRMISSRPCYKKHLPRVLALDDINKKELSEIDICDLFITPAIKDDGWDPIRQIRCEVTLTPGPIVVRGNIYSRNKKKKKFADYVLSWEPGVPVAVVEAKDNHCGLIQVLQQALLQPKRFTPSRLVRSVATLITRSHPWKRATF